MTEHIAALIVSFVGLMCCLVLGLLLVLRPGVVQRIVCQPKPRLMFVAFRIASLREYASTPEYVRLLCIIGILLLGVAVIMLYVFARTLLCSGL